MPSKSPKQAAFMRAAAHNRDFARKVHISQQVAQEFVKADQARTAARKRMGKP